MITWLTLLSVLVVLLAYALASVIRHVRPSAEQERFRNWASAYETTRQMDLTTRATIAAMRQAVRDQSKSR